MFNKRECQKIAEEADRKKKRKVDGVVEGWFEGGRKK